MHPLRLFTSLPPHRDLVQLVGGLVLCVGLSASARGADVVESFLEPYRTIDVAATESGIVDKMEVVEGQDVSRGQPLVRLDQDIHKAALEIARRAMEGQGQINAAKSELTLATTRHKKLLSLRERDHATVEEVGRAEMELALAEAKLLIAKETLEIRAAEYDRYRIQLDRRHHPFADFRSRDPRPSGRRGVHQSRRAARRHHCATRSPDRDVLGSRVQGVLLLVEFGCQGAHCGDFAHRRRADRIRLSCRQCPDRHGHREGQNLQFGGNVPRGRAMPPRIG